MRNFRQQAVNHEWIVLHLLPGDPRFCGHKRGKFSVTAILLQPAFKGRHFEILRIARPLQHLVVEYGGDLFHRRAGEHFAGQVKQHHRGRITRRQRVEQCLSLRLVHPILEIAQKGHPLHHDLVIKGQPQIFGKRAFARAIEARYPNAHLILPTLIHRQLHFGEQILKLLLDMFRHKILSDLRLQPLCLRRVIGDHLFNRTVNIFRRVEQLLDQHNIILHIQLA